MRLIDADAFKNYIRGALDDVKHLYKDNGAWAQEITDSFCKDIDEQPTIERRGPGRWREDPSGYGFWICSACGFVSEASGADLLYNFCPHCGADMRPKNGESGSTTCINSEIPNIRTTDERNRIIREGFDHWDDLPDGMEADL